MSETPRDARWLVAAEILWVFTLMVYVLLGTALVPFHGDESTQIMMSRDYHYQFVAGDWDEVQYHDPPLNATEQQLRLLNGAVSNLLFGAAWDLAGYSVHDLNEQWLWGADYRWNVENGHRPADGLLLATRWAAALPGALAVAACFGIARLWQGRWAAYPASAIFATHGIMLLHIRRAYMEGTLLLFSLLVVLVALAWLHRLSLRPRPVIMRSWMYALVLGIAAGLAVASKHSAAVVVAAVYLAVFVAAVWHRFRHWLRVIGWLILSGILALGVFLALNPAWWSDPVARAGEVLALRHGLVADQVAIFPEDVYPDELARVEGLFYHLSVTPPEYYEVAGWEDPIGPEIAAYEATYFTGVRYGQGDTGRLAGGILLAVAGCGALILVGQARERPMLLVLVLWPVATLLFTLLTIPLDWQRYIMPLYPIEALLAGGALGWLLQRLDPSE